MNLKYFKIIFLILSLQMIYIHPAVSQEYPPLPKILPEDRILIIAPHPDDETIAAAGVIQNTLESKSQLRMVWLTNGDSNEYAFLLYKKKPVLKRSAVIKMGTLRRKEAIDAMKVLGVDESQLTFLGYPDFGTMSIFKDFWKSSKSLKSVLTRVRSVPYYSSPSFGKPYIGDSILEDMIRILIEFKPTKIFVTLSSDLNSDHQAAFLFLQVAVWEIKDLIGEPEIYSYLVHSARWPKPKGYHPELAFEPPKRFSTSSIQWYTLKLNPEQIEKKREAILKYKSQRYKPGYLLAFARSNELFGQYPDIKLYDKEESLDWNSVEKEMNIESQIYDEDYPGSNTIEEVLYAKTADSLYVKIKSPTYKSRLFGVNLFLYGYKKDKHFSEMPKLRFHFQRPNKVVIYDKRHPVMLPDIKYEYKKREIEVRIPLKLLDNPEMILTSVSSWLRGIPQETTAWRVLEFPSEEDNP
ncbi:MAG: PIG-L family deacetylase [Candidatus Omnitrophica bacterium]|nr:PIG-L family deacetylase [Candidatus Omnitrophota bacterium]